MVLNFARVLAIVALFPNLFEKENRYKRMTTLSILVALSLGCAITAGVVGNVFCKTMSHMQNHLFTISGVLIAVVVYLAAKTLGDSFLLTVIAVMISAGSLWFHLRGTREDENWILGILYNGDRHQALSAHQLVGELGLPATTESLERVRRMLIAMHRKHRTVRPERSESEDPAGHLRGLVPYRLTIEGLLEVRKWG